MLRLPSSGGPLNVHDPEVTIYVTHKKQIHPFRTPASMRWVLDEILSKGEYAVLGLPAWTPTTIVDIGANSGAFAFYAALHWPAARIVAFEPVARSFALLTKNLADFKNVEAVNAALLDHDGDSRIYYGKHNAGESSLARGENQTEDGEVVAVRRASAELARLGLDRIGILKIDTEGSELKILNDLAPWLPRVDCLLVEYHAAVDRLAIDALLRDHFLVFGGKIMDLDTGVMKYVRRELVRR